METNTEETTTDRHRPYTYPDGDQVVFNIGEHGLEDWALVRDDVPIGPDNRYLNDRRPAPVPEDLELTGEEVLQLTVALLAGVSPEDPAHDLCQKLAGWLRATCTRRGRAA